MKFWIPQLAITALVLALVIGLVWSFSNSSATVMVTPNPGQTAACVPGYIRTTPNFCRQNGNIPGANGTWSNSTACTDRAFYTGTADPVPASAIAVLLRLNTRGIAANAVGIRQNTVSFWNAVGCTGNGVTSTTGFYEFVATIAGTDIGYSSPLVLVPVTGPNQFTTTQSNAGGNGNGEVYGHLVIGYYDQ